MDNELTGMDLIAQERKRQISKEGYSKSHDKQHDNCELALMACCYATPVQLFVKNESFVNMLQFTDPFPFATKYDKRRSYGNSNGNRLPNPEAYSMKERIDLLVKAGALIAAQIDILKKSEK